MAVNLSPFGGVGAQFLDNSGNVLTGGKIFTYAAGTTTNQATFTSSLGNTPLPNPIILNAAGRVPTGEIWLTDGLIYKFVLTDSNDVLIATYDNITGINSNFVNFTNQQEIQTATAGQTVFNLTTTNYAPGTNSLAVYVDGVNQYGPGAQYAYLETDSDTVTFVNGLHVGALVKFTTSAQTTGNATNASVVAYDPPFANSVPTNVEAKLAQYVSVMDFGAVGDGVTDDTNAFLNAVSAVSSNGVIYLPADYNYSISSVNVNGKEITFMGYGATITCSGTNGAFYKTDHGNKLSVFGISFVGTGAGKAINHNSSPSTSVYDELLVQDCSFTMGTGIYGLYCVGTREPRILSNTFYDTNSGNGVYFKDCVSPFVDKCIFKGTSYTGRAIYYPGDGAGTDAGLCLNDSEIMGWDVGLEVVGNDWLVIKGCTIDYCNNSIILENQDGAQIVGNYIGSLDTNPALWIKSNTAAYTPNSTEKVIVQNNTFTGHTVLADYDCVLINGTTVADYLQFANNNFTFYTRYGINLSMLNTRVLINNNLFAELSGAGVAPIYSQLGTNDSGVVVKNNMFSTSATVSDMNLSATAQVNYNIGCTTENKGQFIIAAPVSVYTIPHGCSYTPAVSDCSFTPNGLEPANKNPYLSGADATNIYITLSAPTTVTTGISWRVHRGA